MSRYSLNKRNTSVSSEQKQSISSYKNLYSTFNFTETKKSSFPHRKTLPIDHTALKNYQSQKIFNNKKLKYNKMLNKAKSKSKSNKKIERKTVENITARKSLKNQIFQIGKTLELKFQNSMKEKATIQQNLQTLKKTVHQMNANIIQNKGNEGLKELLNKISEKYEKIVKCCLQLQQEQESKRQIKKSVKQCNKQNKYILNGQKMQKNILNLSYKNNKLKLNLTDMNMKNIMSYHDQFMNQADNFSQSWRDLLSKQKHF